MAGAGRRTFTPGEVLTASNVMNYLQDQAVMNFAGTAARGSAIGTAVSEGMVSYLADTNVVQAYDGSAWNSLAYATAVPTNAQNGLKPIIPTGVTVSSGSGSYDSTTGLVTFTNATNINMAGVFTSTYKYYLLVLATRPNSTSEIGAWFTNAGTSITAGWYGATWYVAYGGGSGTNGLRNNGNGGFIATSQGGSYGSNTAAEFYIEQGVRGQWTYHSHARAYGADYFGGYGVDGNFDGFRISPLTGGVTMTGTMKIYGRN